MSAFLSTINLRSCNLSQVLQTVLKPDFVLPTKKPKLPNTEVTAI